MSARFQHWFPLSAIEFDSLSTTTCNTTLSAFTTAYNTAPSSLQAALNLGIGQSPIYQLCKDHASCLLGNSTEWSKANLATTNLVLGLLPTILAVIAPSMTEMAVLALRRPVLSAILSVSSPAILQGRLFDYQHPGDVLNVEHPRHDVRRPLVLGPWQRSATVMAGVGGLVLALGCFVNTLVLVVQLTNSSILSWGCTRTWPLYVWMFVPIVIHGVASWGYWFTMEKKKEVKGGETEMELLTHRGRGSSSGKGNDQADVSCVASPPGSLKPPHRSPSLLDRLRNEMTSCTSHKHARFEARSRLTHPRRLHAGVVLNSIAGFLGFLHLVFATATFSALLFIAPLDAIGQIAMRLMLSALVCRLVVVFEVAGLRGQSPDAKELEGSG